MGLISKRKQTFLHLTSVGKLVIISLIVSLSTALIDTVWALYMDGFVHNESIVGFISSGLLLLAFFSYFFIIPFIERNSKSKIYATSLFILAISYILFAINTNFYVFVLIAVLVTIVHTLRTTSFGIIIRDKSNKKTLPGNEGLVYTFMNLAWIVGPLLAGFIAERYGINKVFILSTIFIFLAFVLFRISKVNDCNICKKTHKDMFKNFKMFFKDKQRILTYILSAGVNIWWGFIYLFIPLHIVRNGLNDLWVGYFLFAVAIPLILTEYKFSNLAGKIGYKRTFKIAYLIVGVLSFSCFFMPNIYFVLGLLALASFGMAMLESTTETYFFKAIKSKSQENRFYSPFNTSMDSGNFIGRIFASIVLLFFSFEYLFILFGLFMFALFLLASKAKNFFS